MKSSRRSWPGRTVCGLLFTLAPPPPPPLFGCPIEGMRNLSSPAKEDQYCLRADLLWMVARQPKRSGTRKSAPAAEFALGDRSRPARSASRSVVPLLASVSARPPEHLIFGRRAKKEAKETIRRRQRRLSSASSQSNFGRADLKFKPDPEQSAARALGSSAAQQEWDAELARARGRGRDRGPHR